MRVRLLCEGGLDGRIGAVGESRGAAVIILHRLISENVGRQLDLGEILAGRLPRLTRGGGLRRKIKLAIAEAESDGGVDSLVVLVDRDKPEYNNRLSELETGITECAGAEIASRTVAGMAIEELEAWLIADHDLLTSKFEVAKGELRNPEGQKDPKTIFQRVLQAAGHDRAEGYDLVASKVNFTTVEAKCRAFKRFASGVRGKLTER